MQRDLTDDEREQYEQEWNDLEEKVILAQILTELQQIRLALTDADTGASADRDDETVYDCQRCSATVTADERERHARKTHKAHGDMIDGLFTEVDG